MDIRTRYRKLGSRRFVRWFLIKRVGKGIVRTADDLMVGQSLIADQPTFESSTFPWVPELEASWKEIRRELDTILEHRERVPSLTEIQPDQTKISPDARWRTFFFQGLGYRSEHNRALCPVTSAALDRIPGVELAFFSILAPGAHVPRHSGFTKGTVRCHLGLKVPREAEKCRMQVGDRSFHWQDGRAVLFDDTFKHEVWNDTDEERVVLLFDFRRPMRWPGNVVFRLVRALLLLSPYALETNRNQRKWEAGDGRAFEPAPAAAEALL
jgi:beta-hydroxylase